MLSPSDIEFVIEDKHFEYLSIQRGAVSDFRHTRLLWEDKYKDSLFDIYYSLVPGLPKNAMSILDVGSGLGGIDVLLHKHYPMSSICLLDGTNDLAEVISHNKPFSNRQVAHDFMVKNGVDTAWFIDPALVPSVVSPHFDLVVSFASYCFHYPPETYLEFIKANITDDAVLIFDVRKSQNHWFEALDKAFEVQGTLGGADKYERMIYKSKPKKELS